MKTIITSAPGKIHLSGEHSVVYGQPACLAAINKRCFVSFKKRNDEKIKIKDKVLNVEEELTFGQIRQFAFQLKKTKPNQDPLGLVKIGLSKIYGSLAKKPERGFNLEINSQIPISFGLGSSAALAVSLTAGVLSYEGLFPSQAIKKRNFINQISFEIEKYQHGNPSGGDNTIAVFGGMLKFQKKGNNFQFNQLKFSQEKKLPAFLLVNSGRPIESTGEMVSLVARKSLVSNFQFSKTLKEMGKTTNEIIKSLEKNNFSQLNYLLQKNEDLLEKLGVVGKRAKQLVQLIKLAGGAGKICGAGGVKEGSGMILAYSVKIEKLAAALKNKKIKFIEIKLRSEGVKIERN